MKVTPLEDKDFEKKSGNYFGIGAHEVYIKAVRKGKSPNTGSEFVEFDVLGENDAEASVRLYLTEKTVTRSLSIMGAIAVHNKKTDADKQKVRDAFKKIDDTDKLTDTFLSKFVDMQAWILTDEDKSAPKPNGGFYLRSNLYSYEPTLRQPTAAELVSDLTSGGEPETDEIPFE